MDELGRLPLSRLVADAFPRIQESLDGARETAIERADIDKRHVGQPMLAAMFHHVRHAAHLIDAHHGEKAGLPVYFDQFAGLGNSFRQTI
jgi:hypothetical protein